MIKTLEDFGKGQAVNVRWQPGDMFEHDFTGTVTEVNTEYVIVKDQDGDCWDCEPEQLSYNSDEHVHGNEHGL